jgi:hypothetical protein
MPEAVWRALQQNADVLRLLENEKLPAEQLAHAWFSASEIHLRDSREVDFLVQAEGMLAGANVTTFWIFIATPAGLKVVLTIPAHDLIVGPRRFGGYKMITALAATCCAVSTSRLRFNGHRYIEFSHSN